MNLLLPEFGGVCIATAQILYIYRICGAMLGTKELESVVVKSQRCSNLLLGKGASLCLGMNKNSYGKEVL